MLKEMKMISRFVPFFWKFYSCRIESFFLKTTVDYDHGRAAIMALPVELWVDTPVLANIGVEETSLNLVYQKAWENAHGNPDHVRTQKATQALAQTIVDDFAFVPDHYLTVEEAAFVRYVDTLGGVNLTLASAVDGTSEGYGVYAAGPQLLDGMRALNLTRLLHPSGQAAPDIWGSLSRQDLVMKGLLAAALQPANWDKAPELVKEVRQAITTDLSASQALDLACMAQAVGGSAALLTVTPDMVIYQDGRMLPDLQAIAQLIQHMEAGP
jgi:anionic cell wall polymer biosynthesis LytR-Cps2A-Psr (LCP) family protein